MICCFCASVRFGPDGRVTARFRAAYGTSASFSARIDIAWACSSSGTQPDSAEDTRAYLVATACSEAAWRRAAARIFSAC